MRTPEHPVFARNLGFWSKAEQQAVIMARVAIAGVGGEGFPNAEALARLGVSEFMIADPEKMEPENINRVPGATMSTVGRLKVDVLEESILDINPDARVKKYPDGVTPDNVAEFMMGANLVIDGTELTKLELGTALAREARKQDIPVLWPTNVGWGAQVTSFHPHPRRFGNITFERFMGIPDDMPLDEVRDVELSLDRCLAYLPWYGDLDTLAAVQNGAPLPSIVQGVSLASAMASSQAFLHLTREVKNHRSEPIWAPRIRWADALTGESGETCYPRLSHYRKLSRMALRHFIGMNPRASYNPADRE